MALNYITDLKCICADTLQYGIRVALSRFRFDCAKRKGKFDTRALEKMHKAILVYLRKKYKFLLEKYNSADMKIEGQVTSTRDTIWCFWWQGLENAPDLVKTCVNSIRRQNSTSDVIIIDKNTFSQYVNLPDYIIDKVNNGTISYTHFSDILRFNLLKEHGGIWMDSTIFCVNPLQQDYFTAPFFTAKSNESVSECVANFRWTCYLIAGNAGHILFNYIAEFYNCYFKEHNTVLHYFLTDYCIQLAYENIPRIRLVLDSVPVNNELRGVLTKHLCDKYTEDYSMNELQKGADFYKLFWKQDCIEYTNNGEPTVWTYLKNH